MAISDDTLLFKKQHYLTVNDISKSLYYYFDYDERAHSINMPFQHSHSFYEIMILISPSAKHFIEGIPYSLQAGDIVLLRPSILHKSEYPKGSSSKRIIISFLWPSTLWDNPAPYEKLLEIFYNPTPIYRFSVSQRHVIQERLNRIYRFSFQHEDNELVSLLVHTMFLDFLYTLRQSAPYNIYLNEPVVNPTCGKVYSIANYIHSHYSDPLTLNSIARHFFISPCYLSHQFKQVTGYTLTQYVQLTRIKNVQYMLSNSREPISKLAEDCGFNSFSQFNRIFRKLCGQSPSDFRKNSGSQPMNTIL